MPSTAPVEPSTIDERVGVGRAQRDPRRRVVACRPRRCRPASAQLGIGARELERLRAERAPRPRRSAAPRRPRSRTCPREHARVRVVEDRGLDAPPEQLVGLAHEELVEAVLARDQHREPAAAAAGASPLLAQRRDRAGEADRDRRSRAGRRRSRARAHWSRRRRAARRPSAGARSRGAAARCSRPGTARGACRRRAARR